VPPLAHRVIFPLKVALAVTLALLATRALSIADTISATFAALVCTSSVLTTGLRRGAEQLAGSLVGGLCTVLALRLGDAPWVLGLSIVLTFGALELVRLRGAHVVAGFTVIYVYSLPSLGGPGHALEVRLVALSLGVSAAFLVSLVVSAGFYGAHLHAQAHARRRGGGARLSRRLRAPSRGTTGAGARASFAEAEGLVSLLGQELSDAAREAVVRRGLAERPREHRATRGRARRAGAARARAREAAKSPSTRAPPWPRRSRAPWRAAGTRLSRSRGSPARSSAARPSCWPRSHVREERRSP
jgi:uncharacterized membrane protein YccC